MDAKIPARAKKTQRRAQMRPSVLDVNLRGDPWIAGCTHPGLLVMYLNNQPVNLLPGSPLELASLNQILFTLRHRYPRKK
jgi:hypothetical protein